VARDVIKELIPLIADAADQDAGEIKPEARLRGYGIDSVRVVELTVSIEETFGVRVKTQDLAGIHTVRDLARYIEERLGK
jgi:acyl carrier protein